MQTILEETEPAPERLELEMNESVMLDSTDDAVAVMKAIKVLGVRLAMYASGTGYPSLSSVHSDPFDGIKIDRSFIAALGRPEPDRPGRVCNQPIPDHCGY